MRKKKLEQVPNEIAELKKKLAAAESNVLKYRYMIASREASVRYNGNSEKARKDKVVSQALKDYELARARVGGQEHE